MFIALTALLAVLVGIVILKLVFIELFIDFLWYKSQGMSWYFLLRLVYSYIVFAFFTAIFFGIFYINFWFAARMVGAAEDSKDKRTKNLVKTLHNGLRRLYLPLSIVMAVPIAFPLYSHWEEALLYLFSGASGVSDPLFGKDVSFYLFSLPIYRLIQQEVLLAFIILLLAVIFLYWYGSRLLAINNHQLPRMARLHASLLALTTVAILSWGYLLNRYDLLYETVNLPIFFGPGWVEMNIVLPMIWLTVLFLAATGVSLVIAINRGGGWWKAVGAFALLFMVCAIGKNADFFTDAVRKYFVLPNQLDRERPYIKADIVSTLAAFGLSDVEVRNVDTQSPPRFNADDPALVRRLQNVPVWDRETLDAVYEEIQGIRTYYSFPTIDVDRYMIEGDTRQVYLGAREIRLTKLPDSAKNWINLHLQYTHGMGVAMNPAAQGGDEFMTWFIKNVPPKSDFGLPTNRMSIYYGLADKPYVIVPNDSGEIGSFIDGDEAVVHYTGKGGVAIDSLWRKFLFALYFKDKNIFFTAKTNDRSRILFRRNVIDSISHITPFLNLDEDPYVVVTDDGLFWIQDAYTIADNYPLTLPVAEGFNYIRNSVKIVVDAYHGQVSYYISNTDDPIINAYRRMYPGVFRPLEAMPPSLKQHLRYPRDIFSIQVAVYAKYHQQDPDRFFRQEDIWEFSTIAQNRELVPAKPYYLTLDLFQPGKEEFLLFMPMSPFGRDNLRALMTAGSDGDNYGKLFAYLFSRDEQVYGPSQINALINQDVIISGQFTLWDQQGSEIILGKMIIEPTGGSLLYIQPVYLQEEGAVKIPQLKRLIMALGDAVVMAPSLEEAAKMLEKELARKAVNRNRRPPSMRALEDLETQQSDEAAAQPEPADDPQKRPTPPPEPAKKKSPDKPSLPDPSTADG